MVNNNVHNDPPKKFKQALCNVNINNNVVTNVNTGKNNENTEKVVSSHNNNNLLNNAKHHNELGNQV